MGYPRLIWTLMSKNFLIVLQRHPLATVIRAFLLPIALMIFLSLAKNLFVPAAVFGIGPASPVMSLHDGLVTSSGTGRDHVVFVNSGFTGGEIERVINELVPQVQSAGKNATVLEDASQMPLICKSSLRGVSPCYGAVVFTGSPTEGNGGVWNYTIRLDSSLGIGKIDVYKTNNDGETYLLPFQRAIDVAITGVGNTAKLPATTEQYPFTALTPAERDAKIRQRYQGALQSYIGVGFIAAMVGICYHLTGFMATEREMGMSTLIDSMMPVRHGWQAQAVRLFALHASFCLIYLPAWVISSIFLARAVFANTSVAIVLVLHILVGLALASFSLTIAAFFRRSQLSGVTVTLVVILLAILAQSVTWPSTATVTVLSLLFPPCNYVFFITYMAAFEAVPGPTVMTLAGPGRSWSTNGIVLWVFLVIQIIVYPFVGAAIERWLHGSTSGNREVSFHEVAADSPVQLDGFTKIYRAGLLRRIFSFVMGPKEPVVAVDGLTLKAGRGQILALLGANGSGKSTTLDSIAGTQKLTSGNIIIDGSGGVGIAPQKNVLWDEVTVTEHIHIFNRLKTRKGDALASQPQIRQLIRSVDLEDKRKAQAKTLSGGQKRKLQLGVMLTGGNQLCLIDEVSSGLDPISRRKIWDIILAERGLRTIIMTTHFLDEADLLADNIAILSKGTLRAEGTSVELKDRLGSGYRIRVPKTEQDLSRLPDVEGVTRMEMFDMYNYVSPSSSLAAEVIKELEKFGIREYRFSGPTIEDVFLRVAEEVRAESDMAVHENGKEPVGTSQDGSQGLHEKVGEGQDQTPKEALGLLSGRKVGFFHQMGVLFHKRMVILKSNWFAYLAALLLPVIAAGLTTLFIKGQAPAGCAPTDQLSAAVDNTNLLNNPDLKFFLVSGPPDKFNEGQLVDLFAPVLAGLGANVSSLVGGGGSPSSAAGSNGFADLFRNITIVDTLDDFNNFVVTDRKNVTPAGFWLGDANSAPTIAYTTSELGEMFNAWFGQWVLNMVLTNTTIASQYLPFDIPWAANTGNSLQLLVYLGLSLCAYPGFFALYPNVERRRMVRSLEYSNGVRPLPLWLAYVSFDFCIVLASSALIAIIYAAISHIWWHVGYVFLIFMLYGLASIQVAYIFSIWASNQLSAYAFTASYQAVGFLVYLIAYLCTITYAPVNKVDQDLIMVHFVVSAFVPVGSVIRSLFLELNLFSAACVGTHVSTTPGGILQYGGPILYLVVQSVGLFGVLLWLDSTSVISRVKNIFQRPSSSTESSGWDPTVSDDEVANEMERVTSHATSNKDGHHASVVPVPPSSTDGLQVQHLTRSFGRNTAVDNVSFGVKRGEVFALLGPNGAGKSTTISLIRGDLKPSRNGGDVLVEKVSVVRNLANARQHLGVCPQFDAIDQMTVREHLAFYARVRGIADIHHNVDAVLRAVGLAAFADMQAHALSGGNKRKLSLGIALMGNPTVVLLDEPSSGLDAAAKRIMWRTLAATVPGRSILLTTHSMEEADALAGRAGILAKRMLALGTTEQLRHRFGDALHVHFVLRGAPRTDEQAIARVRAWITDKFPGVEVEGKTYHGQMRFSVPAREVVRRIGGDGSAGHAPPPPPSPSPSPSPPQQPKLRSLLHADGTARLQTDTDSEEEEEEEAGADAITPHAGTGRVKSLLRSDGTARLQTDTDSSEEDSIERAPVPGGSSSHEGAAAGGSAGGGGGAGPAAVNFQSAIGSLIVLIEENKARLGIEHYSVSPTTLDQVFLTIVGKHGVQEENTERNARAGLKKSWWRRR